MLQTCRCRITLSLPVKILPRLWCGLSSNFLDHLLYSGVLFFSRPRSDSWPHHGRTFSIYLCLLSFWLTLPGHAWSSSTAFTWHCSLHYLFLQATPLFPVPRTCLPAATVNPVWALYLAFSSWYRFFSLPFASFFSLIVAKVSQISISVSFATWRIQSYLWLLPAGLSWYLSRDLGLL